MVQLMDIEKTTDSEIETLKTWFPDKESSYFWGGPGLNFPFTHDSFLEDIQWGKMATYSLLDEAGGFVGFGQYYEKLGRCHLARLAIAPALRGQGHGHWFISHLMSIGMEDLSTNECSLFVVNHNETALRCYANLGFTREEYPVGHQYFDDIDFMVFQRGYQKGRLG